VKGDVPKSTYEITSGSYVGQKRLEYQYVILEIEQPGIRPLIPEMPPLSNIPPSTDMDYVNEYFVNYLMDTELADNEIYNYGTWLVSGIERVIQQLTDSKGNNQATINIGGFDCNGIDTDSIIDPCTNQRDPACLRLVDFRLGDTNTLHMSVTFRSNDLWSGFPANLAGLQLVKELICQEIGCNDGKIIYSSKGLHIYDHFWDIAKKRVGQ
jgi:thymidylate synthase